MMVFTEMTINKLQKGKILRQPKQIVNMQTILVKKPMNIKKYWIVKFSPILMIIMVKLRMIAQKLPTKTIITMVMADGETTQLVYL